MILERVELTLTGPDEWPADEDSVSAWGKAERSAKESFRIILLDIMREFRRNLPEGFEVEKS